MEVHELIELVDGFRNVYHASPVIVEALNEIESILKESEDWNKGENKFEQINEAIDVAIAALRDPTRDQVRMGRWIREFTPQILSGRTISHCSNCWHRVFWPKEHTNFCPNCGMPMTDEAVDILLERLKVLEDD